MFSYMLEKKDSFLGCMDVSLLTFERNGEQKLKAASVAVIMLSKVKQSCQKQRAQVSGF